MGKELEKKWGLYAQRTIKRHMGKSLMKPAEIAKKLEISTDAFYKKLRRAQFTAGFFFSVLEALNIENINIKEIKKTEENQ